MLTVGIDEVGRGCWAGPLVAAAVILPSDFRLEDGPLELRDSKKLTKLQREKLNEIIQKEALAIGIGWVSPEAIDTGGITQAVKSAMGEALAAITTEYDEIIVDGNINYFADNPKARAVIKADDLFLAVSAASIIAKVARDAYMAEASAKFPGYGFEKHVGYGTAAHIDGLKLLGVSDIHRRSYKPIQAFLEIAA
jgi:ribonuclease HII